jgi:2-phosphosulfolactate phosphatase
MRTSAGVQGLVAATRADPVVTGSFANAAAVAGFVRALDPAVVSLVCMGWNASTVTADDLECAHYLVAGIHGGFPDFGPIRVRLRADPSGAKFFDPRRPWFPAADFEVCTTPSRFGFVLRAVPGPEGTTELLPVPPRSDARARPL